MPLVGATGTEDGDLYVGGGGGGDFFMGGGGGGGEDLFIGSGGGAGVVDLTGESTAGVLGGSRSEGGSHDGGI